MSVTFHGLRNGRPRFDVGDSAPPKWLIEAISPMVGNHEVKAAIVLFVKDGQLQNRKGRIFRPGDVVSEADVADRQRSEAVLPEVHHAID